MRRPITRAAAAAATGLLLLTGCEFEGAYDLPLPGSPVSDDNSYEVTAEFEDILNVVPRSVVMVDDVTVGEVIDVERDGWHAHITMRVREDIELPDNAIAEIRQVSLLGEKYVALEEPVTEEPSGKLGDGDHLGLDDTGRNPEVEEVLGALSYLLSGGGVAQLSTITRELNEVMSGRTNQLRGLLRSLDDFVGVIDAQKGDIIRAMESMNNLTRTLNAERDAITGALDATGPAIDVLHDQHAEIIATLGALERLGRVGGRVITASKDDLLQSLRHLRPILNRLTAAGDKIGSGLNLLISFPFPEEAADVVHGDYADTFTVFEFSLDKLFANLGVPATLDLSGIPGMQQLLDQVANAAPRRPQAGGPLDKLIGPGALQQSLPPDVESLLAGGR